MSPSYAPRAALLVEDDGDLRETLTSAFAHVGYSVSATPTTQAAVWWLRAQTAPPSVIVIDWAMPVREAIDFLRVVVADRRFASIPVVVVADLSRMDRIPAPCVAAVLTKPVRVRTLVEVVDRLCAARRQVATEVTTSVETVAIGRGSRTVVDV